MNKFDLKQYIIDNNYPNGRELRNSHHKKFLSHLLDHTSFLDNVYDTVSNATRCFVVLYGITNIPLCEYCKNPTSIGPHKETKPHYNKNGFRYYCSKSCTAKGTIDKRKNTNKSRYGNEHHMRNDKIKEKVKSTNLKRYGSSCYVSSKEYQDEYRTSYEKRTGYSHHLANPEIIEKRNQRNIEKYGSENPFQFMKDYIQDGFDEKYGFRNPMQVTSIKEKAKTTMIERHGVEHPLQNDAIKEKAIKTNLERYGHSNHTRKHFTENASEILYSKEKLTSLYEFVGNSHVMADVLGLGSHRTVLEHLRSHGIKINDMTESQRSWGEYSICKFLDDNNIQYVTNDREILNGKEVDVYIPDYNLAIEFNGYYWHSDYIRDRFFHQKKSLLSQESGVLLIHIHEDQWATPNKRKILEEKILQKCGKSTRKRIYARKCEIIELSASDTRSFYDTYHIQSYNDCSINYGLLYEGELVACIGFKVYENYHELVRFATSENVIGGFSKLLKYFTRNNDWETIKTYALMDYSNGDVYEKNGFDRVKVTEPNYFYVKKYRRYSRQQMMKHKLSGKLEKYDSELTEKENVKMNGYCLVYDSGSIEYALKRGLSPFSFSTY